VLYIYGLFDDSINQLVYVGQTVNPQGRLANHKSNLAWDFKDTCRMEILEEGEHLTDDDEMFWIRYMKSIGADLKNKRVYGQPRPSDQMSLNNGVQVRLPPDIREWIEAEAVAGRISLSARIRQVLDDHMKLAKRGLKGS
jgi:predicted GIY-YIG superfamily endonuclease